MAKNLCPAGKKQLLEFKKTNRVQNFWNLVGTQFLLLNDTTHPPPGSFRAQVYQNFVPLAEKKSSLVLLPLAMHADVTYFKAAVATAYYEQEDDATCLISIKTLDTSPKAKCAMMSTLSHPNSKEIVLSVAKALQTLMVRCEPSVGVSYQDPLCVFDERIYSTSFLPWNENGALAVLRIADFVMKCIQRADFSCEVLITALCLFARFIRQTESFQTKVPTVTPANWRLIFLTCLLISQKSWDDSSLDNLSFAIIWRFAAPSSEDEPSGKDFNEMESAFLNILKFDVYVSPRVYAEVFFELRAIYLKEFGGTVESFPVKPLDQAQHAFLDQKIPPSLARGGGELKSSMTF